MIIDFKSVFSDKILVNFNVDDLIFDKMLITYDTNYNQLKFTFLNKNNSTSYVYLLSHFLNENKLTMIGYKGNSSYYCDISNFINNVLLLNQIRKILLRIIKYDSVI